jgi:hypothetical protein
MAKPLPRDPLIQLDDHEWCPKCKTLTRIPAHAEDEPVPSKIAFKCVHCKTVILNRHDDMGYVAIAIRKP